MIATATAGYEPWPPLVGAALDEAQVTGVVVVPFVGVRCVLVREADAAGCWTLPSGRLQRTDRTWRAAIERVLADESHLGMCDTTPFGVLRSDSHSEELSVVAWAECVTLGPPAGGTATVDVDKAARLLAPTWPLGAQLCRLAARLRRNSCHRPITG